MQGPPEAVLWAPRVATRVPQSMGSPRTVRARLQLPNSMLSRATSPPPGELLSSTRCAITRPLSIFHMSLRFQLAHGCMSQLRSGKGGGRSSFTAECMTDTMFTNISILILRSEWAMVASVCWFLY